MHHCCLLVFRGGGGAGWRERKGRNVASCLFATQERGRGEMMRLCCRFYLFISGWGGWQRCILPVAAQDWGGGRGKQCGQTLVLFPWRTRCEGNRGVSRTDEGGGVCKVLGPSVLEGPGAV